MRNCDVVCQTSAVDMCTDHKSIHRPLFQVSAIAETLQDNQTLAYLIRCVICEIDQIHDIKDRRKPFVREEQDRRSPPLCAPEARHFSI